MQGTVRQTFTYFSTVAFGQLVSFLLLPIVTRYLSPEVYGEYSLALTVSSLVGVIGSSWIRNVAFRLYYDAREIEESLSFYWTVAVLQALVVAGVLAATTLVIILLHVESLSAEVLVVAGISTIAGDFYTLTSNTLRAEQRATQFAAAEIGNGLTRLAVTTGALWIGYRSPATLFGVTAVALTLFGSVSCWVLQRHLSGGRRFRAGLIPSILSIGIKSIPFSLGVWAMALADRLVLRYFWNDEVVGIYSVGYALADRIVTGLVSAVFMMAWPTILEAWTRGGKESAVRAIHHSTRVFLWLTIGPLGFVLVFHRDLLAHLTSPAYSTAAQVVPIVAIAAWIMGFTTYLNRSFELEKRYGAISGVAIAGAAINLGANWLLVEKFGPIGAAVATLAGAVSTLGMSVLAGDRSFVRVPYGAALVSGALALAAWVVSQRIPGNIVYQASAFIIIYGLGALLALGRVRNAGRSSDSRDFA